VRRADEIELIRAPLDTQITANKLKEDNAPFFLKF